MTPRPTIELVRPPEGREGEGKPRLCVLVPLSGFLIFEIEDAGGGEAALGRYWIENDGIPLRTPRPLELCGSEYERLSAAALEVAQEAADERGRAARERTEP